MQRKKVFVLGSNSFSGSDFIDYLLEKDLYEVFAISRSSEKDAIFLPYKKNKKKVPFFQIDLNHDFELLKDLLERHQPAYIVNFASQSEVAPSWKYPEHWFQTNAVALTKLASFLKEASYLEKFVQISSPEVYGTCEGVVCEDAPLNPSTPYAASKAATDLSFMTFYKNFGFPVVFVRSTNVYGAHQQLFKLIPRSIISMKLGKKIPLHGGGIAIKSYIHIRDVSRGELLVMEEGSPGEIYHFSPKKGVAVKEVVSLLCSKMSRCFKEETLVEEERLGQDKAYVIDATKVYQKWGWKPEISLDKGLHQAIAWVEENFSKIQTFPLEYQHRA